MNRFHWSVLACLALPLAPARAADGGDVFDQECAECHSVAKPPRNKKGASLVGMMGRKAATVDGVQYSDALKASGIVWTRETMDAYVKNPKAVVPGGGTMKYDGLPDGAARAALVDFLDQQK